MCIVDEYKSTFVGLNPPYCGNSLNRRTPMPHFLQEFVSAHPPGWLQGDFYSAFFIAQRPLLNDNFRPKLQEGREGNLFLWLPDPDFPFICVSYRVTELSKLKTNLKHKRELCITKRSICNMNLPFVTLYVASRASFWARPNSNSGNENGVEDERERERGNANK